MGGDNLTIKEIRKSTGLSQSKFAAKFGIPCRTIQKWEIGQAEPRPYVLKMMERIIDLEKKVGGTT